MNDIQSKFIEEEEEEIDLQYMKYLTFLTDSRMFAFPIKTVVEILELIDPMPIPDFPDYVKGVINSKGRVVPLVDIRKRFNFPEVEYNDRTCIIVVSVNNVQIGYIVDNVQSVVQLDEDMISDPPTITSDGITKYITGIAKSGNSMIILLDPQKILEDNDMRMLSKVSDDNKKN